MSVIRDLEEYGMPWKFYLGVFLVVACLPFLGACNCMEDGVAGASLILEITPRELIFDATVGETQTKTVRVFAKASL